MKNKERHVKVEYNHNEVEKKWQKTWLQAKVYTPDIQNSKRPFYNLMMFPYPSAEGLHVGNMYAFTGADVFGRFKRMLGFDVFEPIGLDGFGIHSENYAIKIGRHPKEHARISEKNYYKQLHQIGAAYDWERTLETYDPSYYKWTQWLFLKMFKAGLAYKDKAQVNWCPSCKTVLADEQVVTPAQAGKEPRDENGKPISESEKTVAELRVCERCATVATRREMSSWFFGITKYADKLLRNIEKIDWPEKIKTTQRQWIGRSEGLRIEFRLSNNQPIPVWTKFWETTFGTTFIVVAPEYAKNYLIKAVPQSYAKDVKEYIEISLNRSEQERKENKEKKGVYTGLKAINPLNGNSVPVYCSEYVLSDVGTGAVMGVPAHDERDFAFAKKYNLKILQVVSYSDPNIDEKVKKGQMPYEGEGRLVNSGKFNGMDAWGRGKSEMASWMIEKGFASWEVNYHLRDWLISRQRYWGPPIPMIFCESCKENGLTFKGSPLKGMEGWFPVPEKDLPVILPDIKDFKPKGDGTSPLHNAPESWKSVECPNCGKSAIRELDVSDTFLDSSWYFLRYPSVNQSLEKSTIGDNINSKIQNPTANSQRLPWNPGITRNWLPVSAYIGGAEHAVLHLLYARFIWMFLLDSGYLDVPKTSDEPFPFLFSHGLIIKDGAKMSKSRGNIVNPDEYIAKFGADALRTYLMFLGPYSEGGDFRDSGIEGMGRFIKRLWRMFQNLDENSKEDLEVTIKMHQTIKKATGDIENFKYNTALAAIMEWVNSLNLKGVYAPVYLEALVKLIAPFTPHLAEEVWQKYFRGQTSDIKGQFKSVHTAPWPKYDEKYLKEDKLTIIVQVNGKLRATFEASLSSTKDEVLKAAKENVAVSKWLSQKSVVKEIYVPGKLVNFVVSH